MADKPTNIADTVKDIPSAKGKAYPNGAFATFCEYLGGYFKGTYDYLMAQGEYAPKGKEKKEMQPAYAH